MVARSPALRSNGSDDRTRDATARQRLTPVGGARDGPASRVLPFSLGHWRVEPASCRLSADGTTVHVRPQLMELLVFLAEHAAEVALKDQILEQLWNGRFVSESCLTKCVAQLRNVLGGQPHDRNFIETIPKRGYRLVAPVHPILEPDRGVKSRVAAGRSGAQARLPVTVAVLLGIGLGLLLGRWAAGKR